MKTLRHTELQAAARLVKAGGLLVYPTDTIWGLGGNGLDPEVAARVRALKGKPPDAPLIWLLPSIRAVEKHLGSLAPLQQKMLNKKHTTVIVNNQAVRVVKAGWLNKLLTACGVPLIATSANQHTQTVITSWRQGYKLFGHAATVIRGRRVYKTVPSSLIAIEHDQIKVLRAGSGLC